MLVETCRDGRSVQRSLDRKGHTEAEVAVADGAVRHHASGRTAGSTGMTDTHHEPSRGTREILLETKGTGGGANPAATKGTTPLIPANHDVSQAVSALACRMATWTDLSTALTSYLKGRFSE